MPAPTGTGNSIMQQPWFQNVLRNIQAGGGNMQQPVGGYGALPAMNQNPAVPFWMRAFGGVPAMGAAPIQPIGPAQGFTGNLPGAAMQARPPQLPPPAPPAPTASMNSQFTNPDPMAFNPNTGVGNWTRFLG